VPWQPLYYRAGWYVLDAVATRANNHHTKYFVHFTPNSQPFYYRAGWYVLDAVATRANNHHTKYFVHLIPNSQPFYYCAGWYVIGAVATILLPRWLVCIRCRGNSGE